MTTTPPLYIDSGWLTAAAPAYPDPSGWLSASMPRQADTTTVKTAESPPPKTYLVVADQSYPVLYEDHTPPTNIVSDMRPQITVAIVNKGDNTIALLKTSLLKGTVALLLPDNRTITMQSPTIESMKYLDN